MTVLEHNGERYRWNGHTWVDKRHMTPPAPVVHALNERLATLRSTDDAAITDPEQLLELAKQARDAGQLLRAERLSRRALTLEPAHVGAAAVLCSVLRKRNRPEDALASTDRLSRTEYTPLLCSRAGAMFDLARWQEGKRILDRAAAIERARTGRISEPLQALYGAYEHGYRD